MQLDRIFLDRITRIGQVGQLVIFNSYQCGCFRGNPFAGRRNRDDFMADVGHVAGRQQIDKDIIVDVSYRKGHLLCDGREMEPGGYL